MADTPIKILKDNCTGCGLCVKSCPFGAMLIEYEVAKIDLEKCNFCGACLEACNFDAIDLKKPEKPVQAGLGDYRDVWVFVEQDACEIHSITYELLGEGRKLADSLKMKLCAVLLGKDVGKMTSALVSRGADKVYVVDKPELEYFSDEPYAAVLTDLIRKHKPNVFLCGATAVGRSLISRVAVPVYTGLTADCTGLAIDPQTGNLLQTRPAFGGNIMATILTPNTRPQMATVRHKVMKEALVDGSRKGEILIQEVAAALLKSRAKRIRFEAEKESTVNLAEADIIVSGGRGIQKPENFAILREFAETIGAGLGASRATVDAGWIPYSHQVGQTGKTVCPKIYFACGISGQIQHLAGMASSEIIVAINKDPDAPIFKPATYGIVGDVLKIVPLLTAEFKKLLA